MATKRFPGPLGTVADKPAESTVILADQTQTFGHEQVGDVQGKQLLEAVELPRQAGLKLISTQL